VNDEAYDKFSHHIGRYPCVVIAPDDAVLITGGSEERRKFLDALLSQLDNEYLQQLITYTKVLQQRNSLLKTAAETGNRNEALLEVLDKQLIKPGEYIFKKRKDFLVSFLPAVKHHYSHIASDMEDIYLFYESELLNISFEALLKQNRAKDHQLMRTCSGIHKDDLDIQMGKQTFKNIASQGQRKSLLFALKLEEMDVLKKEKGFAPLLLLDDVFEKLDEERISNLLNKVCVENDGQVYITDTNEERLVKHIDALGVKCQLIKT
jgi:DNA replication and repair protein RecF